MTQRYDYVTFDGTLVDVRDPWATNFTWNDIRLPMLNMRRYNGQIDVRLVTHSLLVAELMRAHGHVAMGYGGVHDFGETMIQDIVNGIKELLPEYKHGLEPKWDQRMLEFVGLPPRTPEMAKLVKHYDVRAFLIETHNAGHAVYPIAYPKLGGPVTEEEARILKTIQSLDPELQWVGLRTVVDRAVRELGVTSGQEA